MVFVLLTVILYVFPGRCGVEEVFSDNAASVGHWICWVHHEAVEIRTGSASAGADDRYQALMMNSSTYSILASSINAQRLLIETYKFFMIGKRINMNLWIYANI